MSIFSRRSSEARPVSPPPTEGGLTRRQLLGGVVGSAALGVLATFPDPLAHADGAPAPAKVPARDVLWLHGTQNGVPGYSLQAITPGGSQVAQMTGMAHAVTHTADGQLVVEAVAVKGQRMLLRVFDAGNAKLLRQVAGSFVWPEEAAVQVAAGASTSHVVVVGDYMVVTPNGTSYTKEGPTGKPETRPGVDYTAYRGIEVIDVTTAEVISSQAPRQVPFGSSIELVNSGSSFTIVDQGPDQTVFSSATHKAATKANSHGLGYHAHLAHVDSSGNAFLFDDDGNLLIRDPNRITATVPLKLHEIRQLTARPFAPTVVDIGPASVVVVDASRQYAAIVDTAQGTIRTTRKLSTSNTFVAEINHSAPGVCADLTRSRLYIADPSGTEGGVWVHDAQTLQVLDRWHSDTAFGLVWVGPANGAVYAQSTAGPVAIHDANGRLVTFVASALVTTRAL